MICNCPNISGLLKAGAKRKGLFIAAVAVSLLLYSAVAAWKAIPPMYSSWCSIKFSPPRVKEGLVGRLLSTSPDEIETQRAIILSHNFLMHAAAELSLVKSPAAEADLNRAIEYLRSCLSVER